MSNAGAANDRSEELYQGALSARARAYSPYSGYPVGSALLAKDGRVFHGANVENASYGLTICAERSAIAASVMAGAGPIVAAAVATESSPPAAPCGMCLQTLAEFANDPATFRILLTNPAGERVETTLAECLPRGFRREQLSNRSNS